MKNILKTHFLLFFITFLSACGDDEKVIERQRVAERLAQMEKISIEEQRKEKINHTEETIDPSIQICTAEIELRKINAKKAKNKKITKWL